ncbi:MAG: PorT family protein [Muribaculum sp.]|nr:PorT family protein [Muribaculaceae bacterium]MCM1081337.1 PorT family protein [Muribaculum sp.]
MRILRTIILSLVVVAAAFGAQHTAAQFRFGVKAGMNVSSMHFSSKVLDADNRMGFTGGLTTEFTVPVIGLGFDLSAMYVHRNDRWAREEESGTNNRDYIEIPLNLKYKIGLPVVGKIVTPYLTTGPSVSFLTSRRAINDAMRNKSVDWAWNFGFGLQLLSKVQVGASYGLGLTNALKATGVDNSTKNIDGKNRYWTVTAAYFF